MSATPSDPSAGDSAASVPLNADQVAAERAVARIEDTDRRDRATAKLAELFKAQRAASLARSELAAAQAASDALDARAARNNTRNSAARQRDILRRRQQSVADKVRNAEAEIDALLSAGGADYELGQLEQQLRAQQALVARIEAQRRTIARAPRRGTADERAARELDAAIDAASARVRAARARVAERLEGSATQVLRAVVDGLREQLASNDARIESVELRGVRRKQRKRAARALAAAQAAAQSAESALQAAKVAFDTDYDADVAEYRERVAEERRRELRTLASSARAAADDNERRARNLLELAAALDAQRVDVRAARVASGRLAPRDIDELAGEARERLASARDAHSELAAARTELHRVRRDEAARANDVSVRLFALAAQPASDERRAWLVAKDDGAQKRVRATVQRLEAVRDERERVASAAAALVASANDRVPPFARAPRPTSAVASPDARSESNAVLATRLRASLDRSLRARADARRATAVANAQRSYASGIDAEVAAVVP